MQWLPVWGLIVQGRIFLEIFAAFKPDFDAFVRWQSSEWIFIDTKLLILLVF